MDVSEQFAPVCTFGPLEDDWDGYKPFTAAIGDKAEHGNWVCEDFLLYVYIYICIYVCMYVFMYACMYAYTYTYVYMYIASIYLCISIFFLSMYIHMCPCMLRESLNIPGHQALKL